MGITRQRQVILQILVDSHAHITADQILEKARLIYPHISKGTVYRNLNLMADEGVIRRVHIPGDPVLYDANVAPHQHMVCTECGSVADVGEMERADVQRLIGPDAQAVDYRLVIYAVCKNCAEKR